MTGQFRDEQIFVAVVVEVAGVDPHVCLELSVHTRRHAR